MDKHITMNVNTSIADIKKITDMMIEDRELNRSAFMRRMIRQEYSRRHPEAVEAKTGVQEC